MVPGIYCSNFKCAIFIYISWIDNFLQAKLLFGQYHKIPSQHWFRQWLGAVRQQAITCINVYEDRRRQMASLVHNWLKKSDFNSLKSQYLFLFGAKPFLANQWVNIWVNIWVFLLCYPGVSYFCWLCTKCYKSRVLLPSVQRYISEDIIQCIYMYR